MAGRVEISREDVAVIAENLMDEAKPPIEVPFEEAAFRSPTESVVDHQIKTPIAPQLVISFVEELDRAQQHFELVDDIFKIIKDRMTAEAFSLAFYFHTINQEHHVFPLLCLSDFYHYLKAYFVARNEHPDLIHARATFQKKEAYICSGPAFDLLFEARYHGYMLDKDPRVELQKLQECTPHIYDSILRQKPPVDRQARTVTVSNLSDEVLGEDIWYFFSTCGAVEHVEMKSYLDGQIAEITFKDVRSAEFAAECSIYPTFGHQFQQYEDKLLLIQLNTDADVKKAEETVADVKKAEDTDTAADVDKRAEKVYREIQMLYGKANQIKRDREIQMLYGKANQIKRDTGTHLVLCP